MLVGISSTRKPSRVHADADVEVEVSALEITNSELGTRLPPGACACRANDHASAPMLPLLTTLSSQSRVPRQPKAAITFSRVAGFNGMC